MKTFYITLVAVLVTCAFTQAHAQIILGSYFDSAVNSQTINTVADFIAAGVTVPGGVPLSLTDTVTGFDFNPAQDANAFGANNNGNPVPASFTSNGLTLTPNGSYFTHGTGVYQSSVMLSSGESLSGLSSILLPNTTYTLDLFSNAIFSGNQNVSFSYGTQSGLDQDVSGSTLATFTFSTGSSVQDTLGFNAVGGTTSPAGFPSISGFAIIAESVPEPSSYALMLAGLGALALVARRRRV